jgi:hypothetical protein
MIGVMSAQSRKSSELAAEYRQSADECCEKAVASKDEIEKARWLKMAEEWVKLAQQAEPASLETSN